MKTLIRWPARILNRVLRRTLSGAGLVLLAVASAQLASAATPALTPRGETVHLPQNSPMPDSVLAIVDRDRRISRRDFEAGWHKVRPPARPDSLTPQAAREFLDLLIGREALAARALREKFTWTSEESLRYRGLEDRLVLAAALDSALRDVQNRMLDKGDTLSDAGALGIAARETTVARMRIEWNEPALKRMAGAYAALPRPSPDSSLAATMRVLGALPQLTPAERATALATADRRPFTAGELIDSWKMINPLNRPRIENVDQVRDLVKNGLFERTLREDAKRRDLNRRPDIVKQLAREREFYAVEHYVAREVYAKIDTSRATLERFYNEHPQYWKIPQRARLLLLTMGDRQSAAAMGVRLANAADAESLAAQAARRGVRYAVEITAETDPRLFQRAIAAGPGAVIGPDSVADGWRVVRVKEIADAWTRTFQESRGLVLRRWYGEEGERLMAGLLDRVRQGTSIVVNERALKKIPPL